MRTTSSTMSALPSMSGRHDGTRDLHACCPARRRRSRACSSTRRISVERQVEAGEALHLAEREVDDRLRRLGLAGDDDLGRRAAAELDHHLRREFEPRQHEGRIDAALEAIARVGVDAELAAGLRDVERLPQRRLDQHVGGGLVAARGLAAHDAGERFDAVVVGDHAHGVVERVGLAVERQQLSRRPARGARRDCPCTFVGVEHMQRPAAVEGDVVGDVDQRVDRAQADGRQPLLQPLRRRAVLDAAHEAQRERRAERMASAPKSSVTATGQGNSPLTGLRRAILERAEAGGGEIARDAVTPVQSGRFGVRLMSITGSSRPAYFGVALRRPARRPAVR